MHVGVIGTGYVGLVTGACFAEMGNDVILMDIDYDKIENLKSGRIPIYEPGLDQVIKRNCQEKRLSFTTDLEFTIRNSLINFIAVGTPPGPDGCADLSQVYDVAHNIGRVIDNYKIIVTKSTVPVGTSRKIKEIIAGITSHPFDIASNPEFLKEGNAIDDCMKPDRIVIGVEDVRAGEILKELFSPFMRTGKPVMVMNIESSEMTKYAANGLLATKISFMNELSRLAEQVGADIELVRAGIGSDPRIGNQFLFAGLGYGGSCFPKDVEALTKTGLQHGVQLRILEAVQEANKTQRRHFCEKIFAHYGSSSLAGKTFAVWGLSFKPRTDDIRDAPSLEVIQTLLNSGATVRVFDPVAVENAAHVLGETVDYSANNYECVDGADALVIVTEWNEFRHPDFDRLKKGLKEPVIFDGRNLYDVKRMEALGFRYYSVGRPSIAR
ncbi:MAG: UDPglucose 6-dehydrogenase [Thermodesulfobacteriota bacterium]|nr:UDPglucose 6-dehydrogenase [Thermodesulfobacteriota bacterium]